MSHGGETVWHGGETVWLGVETVWHGAETVWLGGGADLRSNVEFNSVQSGNSS